MGCPRAPGPAGRGRLNRRAIVSRGDAALGLLGYQICLLADRLTPSHVHRPSGDDFQDLKEASEYFGVLDVFRGVVRSTLVPQVELVVVGTDAKRLAIHQGEHLRAA